jgi:hypothetical protein
MERENDDNSTCEIEVTPEMIEAGLHEILEGIDLCCFSDDELKCAITRVFRKMYKSQI